MTKHSDLSFDIITNTLSLLHNTPGKPLPKKPRLQVQTPTCPFCLLAEQLPDSLPDQPLILTDPSGPRPVQALTPFTFQIPNLWGTLDPLGGTSQLIILREHLLGFEELSLEQAVDLLDLLTAAFHRLTGINRLAFINVGIGSGSSIAHFHAQAVSSPLAPTSTLLSFSDRELIKSDLTKALAAKLLIYSDDPRLNSQADPQVKPLSPIYAYVPTTMSRGFELRLQGGSNPTRAQLLIDLLLALQTLIGSFNYNIIIHPESGLTQLLINLDYGIIYPYFFGVNLQLTSSLDLASQLRPLLNPEL